MNEKGIYCANMVHCMTWVYLRSRTILTRKHSKELDPNVINKFPHCSPIRCVCVTSATVHCTYTVHMHEVLLKTTQSIWINTASIAVFCIFLFFFFLHMYIRPSPAAAQSHWKWVCFYRSYDEYMNQSEPGTLDPIYRVATPVCSYRILINNCFVDQRFPQDPLAFGLYPIALSWGLKPS